MDAQITAAIAAEAKAQIGPLMVDWRRKLKESVMDYMRKNAKKEVALAITEEMTELSEEHVERLIKEQAEDVLHEQVNELVREVMDEQIKTAARKEMERYMHEKLDDKLQAWISAAFDKSEIIVDAKEADKGSE
jgi:hypothetical protein